MSYEELRDNTLMEVPADMAFRVCRGDVVNNIRDLANCVESLSEEEFKAHVNEEENHVAEWVHHALKNEGLANDLKLDVNHESQEHFVKTIRDHVSWLDSL